MAKYSKGQKKIKNLKKQREKYPAMVGKILNQSDIILEVLDARFIDETRNKEFEEDVLLKEKKLIYVANKADLLKDKKDLKKISTIISPVVFVSCPMRKGTRKLRNLIKEKAKSVLKEGEFNRVVVGVVGYPNTGKSSLINLLIGRNKAGVGSDAGFTKNMQKLKLTSEIVLLDSPGVIPKKEYSSSSVEAIAQHTKVGGRSYSQVKEPEFAISKIMRDHKNILEQFYNIDAEGDSEILIEELGKRKGFFKRHGEVNEDKTSRMILKDWQSGKIKI